MEVNRVVKQGGGRLLKLRCSVQNYDWGRIGADSAVGRLYSLNSEAEIVERKPYAEFWMGTHESGPSFAVPSNGNGVAVGSESRNVSLKSWIRQNPTVLGDMVTAKWGADLPFLFKVLSVAKPLSIQAHPDKELAAILHKMQPNVYKDDNHKPEMALALTGFEALCGFIPLEEFKGILQTVPEIVEVVGTAYVDQALQLNEKGDEEKAKRVLRSIFTNLMSASKNVISEVISKLIHRLNLETKLRKLTDKEQLVLHIEKLYPADVGILAAFLLNHVNLNPGEALYLGANEPHAYISGECIECMATSDNVVRAGLTPKNRDVQVLCSILTYRQGFPEILQGVPLSQYTRRYLPPFDEFEVDQCILPKGASVDFPAVPGPSIFLVFAGEGIISTSSSVDMISEGNVLFAPANTGFSARAKSELHLYRAGVNSRLFSVS